MTQKEDLAEILGLLCAEGCHVISYSSYWEKERDKKRYRKNKKSERIEFYNKDIKLLTHFQKLLYTCFGYNARITKDNKVNIGNRKIINKLIQYTQLGHLNWQVPDFVNKGSTMLKIKFLRGYFDGDGTCSSRIRFFSTNEAGLKQISFLLNSMKISHKFQKPELKQNRKPLHIIQVSEKERETFLNKVKPISKIPGTQLRAAPKNQRFLAGPQNLRFLRG